MPGGNSSSTWNNLDLTGLDLKLRNPCLVEIRRQHYITYKYAATKLLLDVGCCDDKKINMDDGRHFGVALGVV